MKKKSFLITLLPAMLLWSAQFEAIQKKAEHAISQGYIKEAETLYTDFLGQASHTESGITLAHLAITYLKDQEQEKAFKIFLEALEQPIDKQELSNLHEEENNIYQTALKIYLKDGGLVPDETAHTIISQFSSVYEKNGHFHLLGLILAINYANLNQFDLFFDQFYNSYIHYPTHFLVYKTKAALHIKLYERAKTEDQREEHRSHILNNVQKASELEPSDTSLYRMILGFTPDASKPAVLSSCLNKIIDKNIVVSRIDIPYYAEMAMAFDLNELAQKFLDKAQEWYGYSRVITVAQQRLNEKTKKGHYGN